MDVCIIDAIIQTSVVERNKVRRFLTQRSSTVARARRGVPVHCPAGTQSLPDTAYRWQLYDVIITSS